MVSKYLLVIFSCLCGILGKPNEGSGPESKFTFPTGSSSYVNEYYGWDSLFASNITSLIPLLHDHGKSYYFNFNFKATYFQAAQFCEDIHMKLISIETLEENYRIYKYIRDANKGDLFWTSGSKLLDGKHWIWMSEGKPVEFTNWAPGNPDSQTEHCLAAFHSKNIGLTWTDRDCLVTMGFICERRTETNITSGSNNEVSYWSGIYENTYLTPNVPLFHFEQKSYFLGRYFKATFQEAMQICNAMEMDLVSITSEEENNRIYKYIRDTNGGDTFWSSGSRLIDGTTWIWMSKAQLVDYTNWFTGQPDSIVDNCIQLYVQKDKGMFWTDTGCATRLSYICEKPRDIFIYQRKLVLENRQNFENYRNISISPDKMENDTYYLGTEFKVTQSQALEFCRHHNMQLVAIQTEEKKEDIRQLLLSRARAIDGFWTSDIKPKPNFSSAAFLNSTEETPCMVIYPNATSSETVCNQQRSFICEKKPKEETHFSKLPILFKNEITTTSTVKYVTEPTRKPENVASHAVEIETPEYV